MTGRGVWEKMVALLTTFSSHRHQKRSVSRHDKQTSLWVLVTVGTHLFIELTSLQSFITDFCATHVGAESLNKQALPKDYEGVSPGRLILFRKKSRPMVCLYCFPKASCANLVASDVWNRETKETRRGNECQNTSVATYRIKCMLFKAHKCFVLFFFFQENALQTKVKRLFWCTEFSK